MVLVLPKVKGFGEQLGESLGGGIQRGADFALQMGMEKFKQNQRKKLIEEIEGFSSQKPTQQQPSQEVNQQFLDALPEIENQLGRELTPQDLDQIWKNFTQIQSPSQKFAQEAQEDPVKELLMKQKKYAAAGEHELARAAGEEAKIAEKRNIEEKRQSFEKEKEERAQSSKYLEEVTKSRSDLLGQQSSLSAARQAVMEGKEGLSGDFWANFFHVPELKSASGAALDAAAKTHILTSMGNLSGGRPNMFLEKQIGQAFAMPGGSKEANLAKLEILQSLADMKQAELDKALEIATRFESQGRPVPGKIHRMALEEAMPLIEKRQKQSSYRLQEFLEPKEGSEALQKIEKVAKGTPLTQKKAIVIFEKANPGKDISKASDKEIERATKLAEGLGYDVDAITIME